MASPRRPLPKAVVRLLRTRRLAFVAMKVHVCVYRLTRGRVGGRLVGAPVMLLTVRGRKSGVLRTTPLLYVRHDGAYVVAASNGGADREPEWSLNLRACRQATVQCGSAKHHVRPRHIAGAAAEPFWELLADVYPTYLTYRRLTRRDIPVVVLEMDRRAPFYRTRRNRDHAIGERLPVVSVATPLAS